jgi:hypothetical protein
MNKLLLTCLILMAGCDRDMASTRDKRTVFASVKEKNALPKVEDKTTPIPLIEPLADDEVKSYFTENCASCHAKGDKNFADGKFASFWSFNPSNYDGEAVKIDLDAPKVYQTIINRFKSSANSPAAMPPLGENFNSQITERLFVWYKKNAPTILTDVAHLFPNNAKYDNGDVKVDLSFKCSNPATFRQYVRRVTNDAFSREPTPSELGLAGPNPDLPTTKQNREMITNRLANEWRAEFIEKGLKKFAYKVSGAADISYDPVIDSSLREEFYQILKYNYDSMSFKDILLSSNVMVNKDTAELYGCPIPVKDWELCQMKAPRNGYFSTIGFLASKPSSFLIGNNNYGRMALAHFIIHGETLSPATNGPAGETVKPINSCLTSIDRRGTINNDGSIAPKGSMAIPESGNICQSCHISRNLATASILFRPFNGRGDLYNIFTIKNDPGFKAATEAPWVLPDGAGTKPITEEFLQKILSGDNEKSCIISPNSTKVVSSLNELMAALIGDGQVLSKGLTRHMARSLSNLPSISIESLETTRVAYDAGNGKLEPLFKSYFGTETYSCEKIGGQ